VRSESVVSRAFHQVFRAGFLLVGITDVDRSAESEPRSFLLGPGRQDYVGDNYYDNKQSGEWR
jgi:hypothetical protein